MGLYKLLVGEGVEVGVSRTVVRVAQRTPLELTCDPTAKLRKHKKGRWVLCILQEAVRFRGVSNGKAELLFPPGVRVRRVGRVAQEKLHKQTFVRARPMKLTHH